MSFRAETLQEMPLKRPVMPWRRGPSSASALMAIVDVVDSHTGLGIS